MNIKTLLLSGLLSTAGVLFAGSTAKAQTGEDEDFSLYLNASENQPYDVTDKVENASCTGNTGWNRHRNDAAAGYNKHNTDFDSDIYSGTGIESWYWSPEHNGELIWQEVDGLLPGRYRVTAYAVGQVYNDASRKGQNVGSLYLFANDQRTAVTSNKWEEVEVTCEVHAGSTLRIGIAAGDDNANDWVSIAGVRVACIGAGEPEKVALNESYDVCAVNADTYADVYLSKYIPDTCPTWLCLPFNMDETQTATYFSEVKEVTAAEQEGETVRLTLQDAATIRTGIPYLVKALQPDHTLMVVERAFVTPTAPQPVEIGEGITLTGTYRRTEGIEGAYLLSEDGQSLVRADGYTKAKGFSAYLTVEGTESPALQVNYRRGTTAVETLSTTPETTVDVYTLSGIRIRHNVRREEALEGLRKGIYIINRQKVTLP